ncbi:MAG: right-handed parallel beta-helix repeat-containing protein [Sandaracinus sp.]|nr:right-handed parallel beta-helix repeat-containing protein [Sandaracinus sp.]
MKRTWLALVLALVACGDDDTSSDASTPGTDAGPRLDGSVEPVDAGESHDAATADAGEPTPRSTCAERSAAIVGATGTTIRVAPADDGRVLVDGATRTLREVVSSAAEGTTILLEDGTYVLPEAAEGSYTGLYFRTPNVTLRSASGNASAVVIDSAYRLHGGSTAPITIDAPGVVLASFTVRRSVFHLVHLWKDADRVVVHDVRMLDGGQQFLKSSPGDGQNVDDVEVSCSLFDMSEEGRDNAWGYGSPTGNTRCYTGGIDTHDARRWHVHDSVFRGIYCNATGTRHPAHGRAPDQRGGMTYLGGLAEHAIHMWDAEDGGGHVIERNVIANCARGIGLGLQAEVHDTVIVNNTVFSEHAGSGEHDVGIVVERAHDTRVEHNTVFFSSPEAYANGIEYRWGSTSNLTLTNNLTNRLIRARDGAMGTLAGNVTDAEAADFADATSGDLHLSRCDLDGIAGAGATSGVADDLDGDARAATPDVGADECVE